MGGRGAAQYLRVLIAVNLEGNIQDATPQRTDMSKATGAIENSIYLYQDFSNSTTAPQSTKAYDARKKVRKNKTH